MNKEYVISKFKSGVQQIDRKAIILLYGSRARGDSRVDSDWDFLVLTDLPENTETKKLFRDKIFDTELELEEAISTIIHNKEVWQEYEVTPLYQIISKEGIQV
ncbi:MAG: nucleotidyltransferase domain-containing protein [Bacteroidota bacterium]|nr:nucleotidyltransferase domain-containing protein [Bacteroidota bacterium]